MSILLGYLDEGFPVAEVYDSCPSVARRHVQAVVDIWATWHPRTD